jgi:hypothetical protein
MSSDSLNLRQSETQQAFHLLGLFWYLLGLFWHLLGLYLRQSETQQAFYGDLDVRSKKKTEHSLSFTDMMWLAGPARLCVYDWHYAHDATYYTDKKKFKQGCVL